MAGTSGVVALAAAAAVSRSPGLLLALPLVGYVSRSMRGRLQRPCHQAARSHPLLCSHILQGCAWVGHFWFEHNRPATFRYPLWSLAADFHLWWEVLSGQRAF